MSAFEDTAPRRRFGGVRRALWLCLGLQALIGLAVVVEGARDTVPGFWDFGEAPPDMTPGEPVRPDDQLRRFRPGELPAQPSTPASPPPELRTDSTMPETLRAEIVEEGDATYLDLTGAIDDGAADRVRRLLEQSENPPAEIRLHSPGGLVDQALRIGRAIREAGLPVRMTDGAVCLSACPYMLAGGTGRHVAEGAQVGVHQSYYDRSVYLPLFIGVASIQQGEAEAMRFLQDMGVDPLVRIPALETPANQIYLLTPDELLEYRLATEITGGDG